MTELIRKYRNRRQNVGIKINLSSGANQNGAAIPKTMKFF
jgi:hypothetical protein